MIGFVEAPRAWWLTHGMARSVGVSLPSAVTQGWLTRNELARIVSRCQHCDRAEDCSAWLATVAADAHLPDYCCNKAEIEALSVAP